MNKYIVFSRFKLLHNTNLKYSTQSTSKLKWKSVVGLEVHAQINTKSKLFSAAGVEFAAPVNERVALLDASIPGTLPVLNEKCVEAGIRTALALSCEISSVSMFDRKHYFYADLPSGYQITQQRAPLAKYGMLQFPVFIPGVTKKPYYKSARVHQLQLEQDSGKSIHDTYEARSLVDLNRAGVPLIELVFEPDLSTGEEAASLVKELILILTKLETCSCKMEEGALRVDANISIHQADEPLGTRTEVKNIGSVRGVAQAVAYEINRQIEIKNKGGKIFNETRSWDAATKTTIAMRDKEVAQDYRFMPEPNLPPLHVNVEGNIDTINNKLLNVSKLRLTLPELPEQTRQNLVQEYNLASEIGIILVNEQTLLYYFTEIVKQNPKRHAKNVSNFLINELLTFCHKQKLSVDEFTFNATHLGELIDMLENNTINLTLARLILEKMFELNQSDKTPSQIAEENNWKQITDIDELKRICEDAIVKHPSLVDKYRKGKTKVLFAIAGEIARITDQRADMAKVVELLKDMLKK